MQAHDYEAIAICGRVFERHRGSAGPTLLQLKKSRTRTLTVAANTVQLWDVSFKMLQRVCKWIPNKTCFLASKWCEWYVFASNCCKYLACPSVLFGPNNMNAYVLSSLWNMCLTLMICFLSTYCTYTYTYTYIYIVILYLYLYTYTYNHIHIHIDLDIHMCIYICT